MIQDLHKQITQQLLFSNFHVNVFMILDCLILFLIPQAKERVCRLVQSGVDSGAKLLLDGRDIVVSNYICSSSNFCF